jgi:hypothetical protein
MYVDTSRARFDSVGDSGQVIVLYYRLKSHITLLICSGGLWFRFGKDIFSDVYHKVDKPFFPFSLGAIIYHHRWVWCCGMVHLGSTCTGCFLLVDVASRRFTGCPACSVVAWGVCIF